MNIRLLFFIVLFPFLIGFISCEKENSYENTPIENMKVLWQIIDEHYCFLEYKNINWDSIYNVFIPRVYNDISNEALFNIMDEMLDVLQDGHVNISAPFNFARYWKWFEDYPNNFDASIQENYLKTDYRIAGSIKYRILDNNIGYMYYSDFSNFIGNNNMNYILDYLSLCNGIIIDVRNNGGGSLSNVETIASCFTDKKVLTGYIQHKNGKEHTNFSNPYPVYLYPRSSSNTNYYKPVVILTNRRCYSATNEFVNTMMQLPNVTIIGDKTGGGSGLPFSSELPNGWIIRFSASPTLNPQKQHIEFGINPDIKVDMKKEDILNRIDTIIETAISFILNNKS